MKTKRVFEIHVPIKETWIFEVEAKTKAEAWRKYRDHSDQVFQVCSVGGWNAEETNVQGPFLREE